LAHLLVFLLREINDRFLFALPTAYQKKQGVKKNFQYSVAEPLMPNSTPFLHAFSPPGGSLFLYLPSPTPYIPPIATYSARLTRKKSLWPDILKETD
jgi:hypothetical protein